VVCATASTTRKSEPDVEVRRRTRIGVAEVEVNQPAAGPPGTSLPARTRGSSAPGSSRDGRPWSTRRRRPCRYGLRVGAAAPAHSLVPALHGACLRAGEVVEVRLDRRRRAPEPIGDLRDRQALSFTEVARQRHRPATLDHTVVPRRRSIGGHASRYCERRRRPHYRRRRIPHLPRLRMPGPGARPRDKEVPHGTASACSGAFGSRH
jgi:hypothetical protein